MYNELELSWLVGLIEGEGCFSLTRGSDSKKKRFKISFNITNSDLVLIQKSKEIIEKIIGEKCKVCKHQVKKGHYRDMFRVWLYTLGKLQKFITVIYPYLVGGKKLEAQILLQFVERRLSLLDKSKFPYSKVYTEEDMKYLYAMRAAKAKSVETIRSASYRDDDIVRAARINEGAELGRNNLTSLN